ncbi:Uma2 family endonuclease [Tumidithrix helvetica PCC 7403]
MISQPIASPEIDYPDSDGNPMSDNTEQYRWIVIIEENLEIIFADDPNVFIAGDLAWYPVRYALKRTAPDVMVVFGRPRGRRGSYKQWLEDDIAPQQKHQQERQRAERLASRLRALGIDPDDEV